MLSKLLIPPIFLIFFRLLKRKRFKNISLYNLYDPIFSPWKFTKSKHDLQNISEHEKLDLLKFEELRNKILDITLVSNDRLWLLYKLSQNAIMLDGDFVECGVYKGGTALLLSEILRFFRKSKKKLYLFDTFKGMPKTNKKVDNHQMGDFANTSVGSVFKKINNPQSIIIIDGKLPNSIKKTNIKKISFLHIDLDIYSSILETLKILYKKVIPGGIILFDDCGFITCYGARVAVNEFFSNKKEKPIYLQTGQAFIIKR